MEVICRFKNGKEKEVDMGENFPPGKEAIRLAIFPPLPQGPVEGSAVSGCVQSKLFVFHGKWKGSLPIFEEEG